MSETSKNNHYESIRKQRELNQKRNIDNPPVNSFNIYDEIRVSNRSLEEAKTVDQGVNRNEQRYSLGNHSSFIDVLSHDKSVGSVDNLINHNPNIRRPSANKTLEELAKVAFDDDYTKRLKNDASVVNAQIKRLESKKKRLNSQVEYASLDDKQFNDYSFEVDKIDRQINQLKNRYNNYERKYMRETGRDFKGKYNNNVVDVAMRNVVENKAYINRLEAQIENIENIAVGTEKAAVDKEIILSRKRRELERANRQLENSEYRALEVQKWQDSKEGQRQIRRWDRRELKKAQRERSTFYQSGKKVSKGIDAVESVPGRVLKPLDKPLRAVSHGIDKVEYIATAPLRGVGKLADKAYSKAYEGVMRSRVANSADKAFSDVGNAVRKAADGAKSAISHAAKAAGNAVLEMFKKAILFLLTNPVGWAIDIFLVIVILISSLTTSGTATFTEEELQRIDDTTFSSEDVYLQFLFDTEEKLMTFTDKYRIPMATNEVSTMIYSSIDPYIFEEMYEDDYKEKILELLEGDKAVYAAKIFLKQVNYRYYYLYVDWSEWEETDYEVGFDPEPPFDEIKTYEKMVDVEYEVTEHVPNPGGCIYAPEYGYGAQQYNDCLVNPPTKAETHTETRQELKTFYMGRYVNDYEWAESGLNQYGKTAEKPRDTLRVDVNFFVNEADSNDRGEWTWFNPSDGAYTPDQYNGYFIKKEKYWERWDFEEISKLLADNYNLVSNESAVAPPEGFDNFHTDPNNPHVIQFYDYYPDESHRVYQGVSIDLDEFYKLMNEGTQYSFYDYITAENQREPEGIAEQLEFIHQIMTYYTQTLYIDTLGQAGWNYFIDTSRGDYAEVWAHINDLIAQGIVTAVPYNCTAFVQGWLYDTYGWADVYGNGKDMATNANGKHGWVTSSVPIEGGIVSLGRTKENQYGHVAVVESVDYSAGTITISEGNVHTERTYRDVATTTYTMAEWKNRIGTRNVVYAGPAS